MKKQLQKNGLVIYQKEEKQKVLRTGNIMMITVFILTIFLNNKSIIKKRVAYLGTLQKNSVVSFSFINFL